MASAQERIDAVKFWLFILCAVGISVIAGRAAAVMPPAYVFAVAGLAAASLVSFTFPKAGLALVVFSMIFSPRVEMGRISSAVRHGSAIFKADDILLIVIFLAWMARTALFKGRAFLVKTPLNLPIFSFAGICLLATLLGIIRGNLNGVLRPLLYVVKYIEYYLLFFMTVNIVETREDVRRFLGYAWLTAVLVTIYGYTEFSRVGRVHAPFDTPIGLKPEAEVNEANTFGGYYLVVFGVLLGFFTQTSGSVSLIAIASFIFMMGPFLMTLSRSSYGGFALAMIFHIFASRRRQLILLFGLGLGVVVVGMIPRIREAVTTRVEYTFSEGSQVNVGGEKIRLEGSTMARVNNWKWIFTEKFPQRPFLGFGVTGVGLVDAYYPLLFGETGLVGAFFFFWLLSRIWGVGWRLFRISRNAEDKALALGLLTALVALLIHCMAANTFIIVRIMELFWFLTALATRLYINQGSPELDAVPEAAA